jgi:transposase
MTNRIFKIGQSREQGSFLPPRIEDYVAADNPVRAIEAYVCALDLAALGFRHAEGDGGAGQPPYDPADLLKLYLYGYLNQVRSSRRLEREAGRNMELIWLLRGLVPGYRTIGNFRKDNREALKAANRDFVMLARNLDLLGGDLVAIDGAFFHGDASKASIATRKRLAEQLAALERDIEAYSAALEANDADEETKPPPKDPPGPGIAEKLTALLKKRARAKADLAKLEDSGETQLSRTDGDARLLTKNGQSVAGYNVQIAVDDRHKLIVASEVVNDGNDNGQLHAMALAAKQALGVETLRALADVGYYNGETLKACETDAIVAYVPQANRNKRLAGQGRFTLEAFVYDATADVYRCPAGTLLRPMKGYKQDVTGKLQIRYASLRSVCKACPLRLKCLAAKAHRRDIYRWVHEDVIDRHRERMTQADTLMRRRGALAEHPFGTLKCRAGYRHFLLRGFEKVRGEWSLMALCYNFTRVLNILGLDRFIAYLAKRHSNSAILLLYAPIAVLAAFRSIGRISETKSATSRPLSTPHSTTLCHLAENKFLPSLFAIPLRAECGPKSQGLVLRWTFASVRIAAYLMRAGRDEALS